MPVAEDMRAVPTYAKRNPNPNPNPTLAPTLNLTPTPTLTLTRYAKRFTGGNGLITLNPKRIASADQACTEWPSYPYP
jgi:hypothetical protein